MGGAARHEGRAEEPRRVVVEGPELVRLMGLAPDGGEVARGAPGRDRPAPVADGDPVPARVALGG